MIHNTSVVRMATYKLKDLPPMQIERFIDKCLIDEYADKDIFEGYFLDISQIPDNVLSTFLDKLMSEDTNVRDYVHHAMQKLIDERLVECMNNDIARSHEVYLVEDKQTGEQLLRTL